MFALPQTLAHKGLSLREARPEDRGFLRALFATARLDAPFLAQWSAQERETFLDSQFHFQSLHYGQAYAGADSLVLEKDGAPIGRLILDRGQNDWCIVDIAVVPVLRGQGTGAALLEAIQAAALAARAASVSLHVEVGNRARALYARLGFVETEDEGTHIAMSWNCAANPN